METPNTNQKSDVYLDIYDVLARLELVHTNDDSFDRPSAAKELENIMSNKLQEYKDNIRQWIIDEDFESLLSFIEE